MWSELIKEVQSEVESAGLKRRTALKFGAQRMHRKLSAAMDEVGSQLLGGMEHGLSPPASVGLPPSTPRATVHGLCAAALAAFRVGFDRPWQLDALEEELERRCELPPELEAAKRTVEDEYRRKETQAKLAAAVGLHHADDGHSSSAKRGADAPAVAFGSDEPAGALLCLLLGTRSLPLDHEAVDFVTTFVATHLDPFIDGAVGPADRERAGTRPLMQRLAEEWEASEARQCAAPAPPGTREPPRVPPFGVDCVVAAYLTHAIGKMNATFGFELNTKFGVGRPPVSDYEQMRHLVQLGSALVAAIARDFPPDDGAGEDAPSASGLRELSAEELTAVAQTHLRAMHGYHRGLEQALAAANAEGESNRKQERFQLFRIPPDAEL